jgi:hypothetical protein
LGCSSTDPDVKPPRGIACSRPTNDFCDACTRTPDACTAQRPIDACCVYVPAPARELTRGTHLSRNSASDPRVDLGCLRDPGKAETSRAVRVTGFVSAYRGGLDTKDVRIQIFREGPNGALGELVSEPYTTSSKDATSTEGCLFGPCVRRAFVYQAVPTETPLIVKTGNVRVGGGTWADRYEYNVVFRNAQVRDDGTVDYEAVAVDPNDVVTLGATAGGIYADPSMATLTGEVLDCGGVRLGGALVETSARHQGPMIYFGEKESDPVPDTQAAFAGYGTSRVGTFSALNVVPGTAARVSVVGKYEGETLLLGTQTVQMFPGAVTALSFRGRRPWHAGGGVN